MSQTLAAAKRSLWLQRSGACLIWLTIICKIAAIVWLEAKSSRWCWLDMIMSVFWPSHWMSTLALVTLQAPVVVTQSALLLPVEAEPLQLPSDVAAVKRTVIQLLLRWTPTSCLRARQGASSSIPDSKGLNLLFKLWQGGPIPNLQQALGRLGSCWQGVKMSMLLVICTFSAILTSQLFSYLKTNSTGDTHTQPSNMPPAILDCLSTKCNFASAVQVHSMMPFLVAS